MDVRGRKNVAIKGVKEHDPTKPFPILITQNPWNDNFELNKILQFENFESEQ